MNVSDLMYGHDEPSAWATVSALLEIANRIEDVEKRVARLEAGAVEQKHKPGLNQNNLDPGWYWVKWGDNELAVAQLRYALSVWSPSSSEPQWFKGQHWTAATPSWVGPRISEPAQS